MSKVFVIHENDAWVEPLRAAFARLGTPYEEWFLDEGVLDLTTPPPEGVRRLLRLRSAPPCPGPPTWAVSTWTHRYWTKAMLAHVVLRRRFTRPVATRDTCKRRTAPAGPGAADAAGKCWQYLDRRVASPEASSALPLGPPTWALPARTLSMGTAPVAECRPIVRRRPHPRHAPPSPLGPPTWAVSAWIHCPHSGGAALT